MVAFMWAFASSREPQKGGMPTTRAIFGNISLLVGAPGPLSANSVILRYSRHHSLHKAAFVRLDRQAGVDGPNGRDLDKRRRTLVPRRNSSVQIGENEVRRLAVSAAIDQERRSVGIVDLASRSLGSAGRFWD
jgi:hypothetical protein